MSEPFNSVPCQAAQCFANSVLPAAELGIRPGLGLGTCQLWACTDRLNNAINPTANCRLRILFIAAFFLAVTAMSAVTKEVHQRTEQKEQINPPSG